MELNFANFPTLITERLILRNIETMDFELIHKLHSDPVVNSFVGRDNSSTLEKAKAYISRIDTLVKNNVCVYWVVTLKGNNDLIGSTGIWNFDNKNRFVEIGYELSPDFQGKGIMLEALKEVIKYTFEVVKAEMITAFPSSDNVKSISILKKLNFKFENKPYNNKHENVKNLVTYTLRKHSWLNM